MKDDYNILCQVRKKVSHIIYTSVYKYELFLII